MLGMICYTWMNTFMNFLMLRIVVKVLKLVPRNVTLKIFNEFRFSRKLQVLHN